MDLVVEGDDKARRRDIVSSHPEQSPVTSRNPKYEPKKKNLIYFKWQNFFNFFINNNGLCLADEHEQSRNSSLLLPKIDFWYCFSLYF